MMWRNDGLGWTNTKTPGPAQRSSPEQLLDERLVLGGSWVGVTGEDLRGPRGRAVPLGP